MATPLYDRVTVGAGLIGSAAAYDATKEGNHGTNRTFRVAFPNDTDTELYLTSLQLCCAVRVADWRSSESTLLGFSLPDNSHAVYNARTGVLNSLLSMATTQTLLGASIRKRRRRCVPCPTPRYSTVCSCIMESAQ
ncbi:hypothetical protein PHYSODRAFT_340315 [Phytophthora sojae]|uniref:Uncharacterized protein n=1 Tax=Phytophthora sojae (strain P6497) TaxID=1094619 RepID=G5AB40_PHYSP|nr:hypothetical protein PHYSODRAFT_340315 [Phytophthora sojae]EGZ07185.1 hypothetical protein PHYSODRAFT_340315 [Phytophthora sojae]|eukprot:XP_009536751.1 hypothetical protein PHYSODRAFT_340315 [Phytophthora sojae]